MNDRSMKTIAPLEIVFITLCDVCFSLAFTYHATKFGEMLPTIIFLCLSMVVFLFPSIALVATFEGDSIDRKAYKEKAGG